MRKRDYYIVISNGISCIGLQIFKLFRFHKFNINVVSNIYRHDYISFKGMMNVIV